MRLLLTLLFTKTTKILIKKCLLNECLFHFLKLVLISNIAASKGLYIFVQNFSLPHNLYHMCLCVCMCMYICVYLYINSIHYMFACVYTTFVYDLGLQN